MAGCATQSVIAWRFPPLQSFAPGIEYVLTSGSGFASGLQPLQHEFKSRFAMSRLRHSPTHVSAGPDPVPHADGIGERPGADLPR